MLCDINMEMAVFTETNIGTRIASSVPVDITTRDFKRKIEREHFGCFPESGKISVCRVGQVNHKSCLYYLPDFMPLKYAFKQMDQAWFVCVEISPSDAPGCSARMAHVSNVNYFMDTSKLQSMSDDTDNGKAKRKRAKMKHCCMKSVSISSGEEKKEGFLSFDHIANGVGKRSHYTEKANPVISTPVNTSELSKEEKMSTMIETPSATSSEVISVGGIIERYFTSFTEVSSFGEVANFSGQCSSSFKGRASQSRPRRCKKQEKDSHITTYEANSSKFTSKTQPKLLSSLSLMGSSPNTSMDRTAGTKVGKCLVTASHLLGLHEKGPIISLSRFKSGKLLNCSPRVNFSVFEISEDEDDEAD